MSDLDHTYDDGEDWDATDTGDDVVPPGTGPALLSGVLDKLAAAGFPPGDPTELTDG